MGGMAQLGRMAGTAAMVAYTWGKYTALAMKLLGLAGVLPVAAGAAVIGAVLGIVVVVWFPERAPITAIVGLPLPSPVDRFLRRQALLLTAVTILFCAVCFARVPSVHPIAA